MSVRTFVVVMLAAISAALPAPAWAGESVVFEGTERIAPDAYEHREFAVDLEEMGEPRLVGRLEASGGTGNDVRIFVFEDEEFRRWEKNRRGRALHESGKHKDVELAVPLERSGIHHLVIDNSFSVFAEKRVTGEVVLRWGRRSGASSTSALGYLALLVVGIVIGAAAVIAWGRRRRR